MSFSRAAGASLAGLFWLWSAAVHANPIVIGVGAEFDDADSRAFTFFTDVGVTENTWLSGAIARTDTDRDVFDLSTAYADIGIDHPFEPVGVRLRAAYWGDDDLLKSNDLGGALYLRGDMGYLAFEYERRDFDLTIGSLLTDETRTVEFSADGIGASASLPVGDGITVYANGMDFDYSRNIRIQPNIDSLRFFSLSRLSMVNSLVDYRASVGVEFEFGLRRLDLRVARWRTEVDQGEIDSFGVGFLMPAGDAADLELRLAYDDSENFGGATVLSFFLYLFDD